MNIVLNATTRSMSIPILPIELLQQIASYLSTHDVPNLRAACTLFSQVFAPYSATSFTLNVDAVLTKSVHEYTTRAGATAFAPTPEAMVPFIRSLTIRLDYRGQDSRPRLLPIVHQEISRLISLRMFTIQWLKSALTVPHIAQMRVDEEGLLLAAFQAAGGALEHLNLVNSYLYPRVLRSPSLFPILLSLKQLDYKAEMGVQVTAFVSQLKGALVGGAILHSLSVDSRDTYNLVVSINRDLFPPRSIVPHLPIRTLRLYGKLDWRPEPDVANIPSFSNLTHLVLVPTLFFSGSLEGFWECLQMTGARLQHLNAHNFITPGMTSYLTSFSGLRELFLGTNSLPIANRPTAHLHIPALLRHASTLEVLLLREPACLRSLPEDEENKSLFVGLWPSPALFPKLKYLYTQSPGNQLLSSTACQSMLEWLEQFPALEHAYTEWGKVECGAPQRRNMGYVHDVIRTSLVARTGRPKYWAYREIQWNSHTFIWKNHARSPEEWYFGVLNDRSGTDMDWWLKE